MIVKCPFCNYQGGQGHACSRELLPPKPIVKPLPPASDGTDAEEGECPPTT